MEEDSNASRGTTHESTLLTVWVNDIDDCPSALPEQDLIAEKLIIGTQIDTKVFLIVESVAYSC